MDATKVLSVIICCLLSISLLPGCGTSSFAERHPDVMNNYRQMPREKALAVAMDPDGDYAYGYGADFDTAEEARQRAMAECEVHRESKNVRTPCRMFMVNDLKIED